MAPFDIDGGLTFWSLATFACLFALLARFAFKPLQRILKEREESIAESLRQARRAREEANELLEKNRLQLDSAREDARRIVHEGHRIVAVMKHEVKESARREADRIIDTARAEIDREVQRSLDGLKSTVAGLSVRISRQIIGEQLDEKRHEEMADEFIERLKQRHAKRPI